MYSSIDSMVLKGSCNKVWLMQIHGGTMFLNDSFLLPGETSVALGLVSNLFRYIPQHSRRVRMGGPQRWKSCASFPAWIFGHGCGPGDSDVTNST